MRFEREYCRPWGLQRQGLRWKVWNVFWSPASSKHKQTENILDLRESHYPAPILDPAHFITAAFFPAQSQIVLNVLCVCLLFLQHVLMDLFFPHVKSCMFSSPEWVLWSDLLVSIYCMFIAYVLCLHYFWERTSAQWLIYKHVLHTYWEGLFFFLHVRSAFSAPRFGSHDLRPWLACFDILNFIQVGTYVHVCVRATPAKKVHNDL